MNQLSPRLILVLVGAILVFAGAALGFVVVLKAEPSRPATATAETPLESDPALPATPPAEEATPTAGGSQTTTGRPEPFWLVKQREAKARMARNKPAASGTTTTGGASTGAGSTGSGLTTAGDPVVASVYVAPPVPTQGTTRQVLSNGQTPIAGRWAGTAEELSSYLLANNPSPRFTVSTLALAQYYVTYSAQAGVRADVLWAQMLVETGFGGYGGDVSSSQNNFAGIGATGGGAAGHGFPTAEAGVKAQIAHMVAYVFATDTASWTNSSADPRFDAVSPRGAARVVADLNGRWAVPGTDYGQNIERLVAGINR